MAYHWDLILDIVAVLWMSLKGVFWDALANRQPFLLNTVIDVWLLTPGKVKTFQITLKESWPAASTRL